MQHDRAGTGKQKSCGQFKGFFVYTLATVPVLLCKLIGQCPVVVNVQILDARQRSFFIRERGTESPFGVFTFGKIPSGIATIGLFVVWIRNRPFKCIPGIVVEITDRSIGLVPVPIRIGLVIRIVGRNPGFAINDHIRTQFLTQHFECLLIGLSCQIDPEAIYTKLFNEMFELINDPPLHHRTIF